MFPNIVLLADVFLSPFMMHGLFFLQSSVGLPNILAMLRSEDLDMQIHGAKVIANLAADGKSFSILTAIVKYLQ